MPDPVATSKENQPKIAQVDPVRSLQVSPSRLKEDQPQNIHFSDEKTFISGQASPMTVTRNNQELKHNSKFETLDEQVAKEDY